MSNQNSTAEPRTEPRGLDGMEGLALLALEQATESANLKAMISELRWTIETRHTLRTLIQTLRKEKRRRANQAVAVQLEQILSDALKGLDSASEMSEMTSMRLQMMLDRRAKFISTLSNILKKISSTQDTLTQNIK